MADAQKVDVINAMGLEHQEYQNKLYAYALSNPSGYAKMRTDVVNLVKIQAIKAFHKSIYELLKYGKVAGEQKINIGNRNFIEPKYPEHELNEFAYGACESLKKVLDEALEIILAKNAEQILVAKHSQIGSMSRETEPI